MQASAVDALLPVGPGPGPAGRVRAAAASLAIAALVGAAFGGDGLLAPANVVGALVLALALTPLLEPLADARGAPARNVAVAAALVAVWFGLHGGLRAALALPPAPTGGWSPAALALLVLLPLPAMRLLLAWRPGHPVVAGLHAACQRGFFLDEWFTRFALRTWRLSPFAAATPFVPDLAPAPRPRGGQS